MSFRADAQEALKQAGGRLTDQRKLIIDLLSNSNHQIDAESLYALAIQQDANTSLATVYRTLNALADAGVLQRRYLSPEHNRQYFERMPDDPVVIYITCRECKNSYPVETDLIARLREELMVRGGWHDVNICSCISGLCADCHAKMTLNNGETDE